MFNSQTNSLLCNDWIVEADKDLLDQFIPGDYRLICYVDGYGEINMVQAEMEGFELRRLENENVAFEVLEEVNEY